MNATSDPRRKELFEPSIESQVIGLPEYVGVPSLVPSGHSIWNNYDLQHASDVSRLSSRVLRADFPSVLLSYSEVCFLLAELSINGLWIGNAQLLYESGIRASIESYNSSLISLSEINAFVASVPPVSVENIITQKWISYCYSNSIEPYAEYRRTGYPSFVNFNGSPINQSIFPQRLTYPSAESILNSQNYNAAVASQGPDIIGTHVWWDIN